MALHPLAKIYCLNLGNRLHGYWWMCDSGGYAYQGWETTLGYLLPHTIVLIQYSFLIIIIYIMKNNENHMLKFFIFILTNVPIGKWGQICKY